MIYRLLIVLLPLVCAFSVESSQPVFGNAASSQHITSGNSFAKEGKHSEALSELNQAIAADPSNARAYKLRGHIYYAMGDYQKSLQDLQQVVNLVRDSANAYCDLAIAHSMVNNHGQALLDIEHALQLQPTSSFAEACREKILERAASKN